MSVAVNEEYDLCVFGCGAGGFAGAMRALDFGKRVCVIEGDAIGGTAVVWGALASKTMWEISKDYAIAARLDRGYRTTDLSVDYQAVRHSVIQAVKEKQTHMLKQLAMFAPERWKGPGAITFKRGWGSLVSPHQAELRAADGRREQIAARNFLITTGSKPRDFPQVRVDQRRVIDSDGIFRLRAFPKRLMIIGAGVTGCEYATIFSNFRQTKVYLADHANRILPFEDRDVSEFVNDNLVKNGVDIFHCAHLQKVVERPECLRVVLDFPDGSSQTVEVDTVLLSIGRSPNLSFLRLDRMGIETEPRGYLSTDENCRVKGNVYAAGDVTHLPNLVNIAEMEARYAVKHMFGYKRWPLNYTNMSTVMFFYPPVASVGLNEQRCQQMKIPYRVAYYGNALVTRAIAMRALDGFVKIIVSDDGKQRILGMRAAGPQVSSTVMSIAMLMDQEKGPEDALKSVYPHPTMSEAIQECLRLLLGKSTYKSRVFPEWLRIWTWHPQSGYRRGPASVRS